MKKLSTLFIAVCLIVQAKSQLVVFSDDYAAGVTFTAFGGSVNNLSLDVSQFHSGSKSLKIVVPSGAYTGGALVAGIPQNLSAYNAVTFWAKNDVSGNTINGAGLGNDATNTLYAVERNAIVVTPTWTKYYIPIPVASKLTAETGLFHFAESEAAPYNLWIDDIQYENVPPGVIGSYTASFGTETLTKAVGEAFSINGATSVYMVNSVEQQMQTARAYFTWLSSNPGVASVNAVGNGTANAGGTATITGKLGMVDASGLLTVNVVAPLAVPTVAAPNPTRAAYSVKSLFSGVYNNSTVSSWATDWSGCCRDYTELQVNGNDVKKYGLRHFTGIQFDNIDATSLDTLHLDVWTPTPASPFTVRLVNFAGATTEGEITTTLAGQQWVSLDLPLNQFKAGGNGAVMGKTNLQQMLLLVPVNTSGTFYVDNVYFYRSGASLPVSLSGFNVTRRGNTSIINWKTFSESNSKGFSVERSTNGTDWKEMQFVNSGLNTSNTKQYSTLDKSPLKGINYYRLKQVDNDGKFTYSSVASLKFSATGVNGFSFYPNPAKNKITVLLETINSTSASLQLMNAEGKMVRNVVISNRSSDSNIIIDIASLTRGLYYIVLKDGPSVQTTKVMID